MAASPVGGDDHGERHDDLGRRDGDDEEGEHLPGPARVGAEGPGGDEEQTAAGEEQLGTYLIDTALAECARSTQPRPENCPIGAPEEVTGEGTWQILTPPQIHVAGGATGYYDAYGYGGLAEFTVTAEDGGTTVHRVPIEEAAIGMMDRDGRFYGTWFGNQETTYY